MTGNQLTFALAAALFLAVVLGWILRWIFGHLNAGPRVNPVEYDALAARCDAAEAEVADLRARLGYPATGPLR